MTTKMITLNIDDDIENDDNRCNDCDAECDPDHLKGKGDNDSIMMMLVVVALLLLMMLTMVILNHLRQQLLCLSVGFHPVCPALLAWRVSVGTHGCFRCS